MAELEQVFERARAESRIAAPAWRTFARALKGTAKVGLTALTVLLLSLSITLSIASHRSPDGQYTVLGHPVMSVLSGSMTPAIRTGDLVIDEPVSAAQAAHLHVGQIITFSSPTDRDVFFTHRIVGIHHSGTSVSYVTKGDANNAPDAVAVPSASIVGLYSHKIPYGGYILNALHKPIVLALLVLSLLLGLLARSLLRLASSAKGSSDTAPARGPGMAGTRVALVPVPSKVSPSATQRPYPLPNSTQELHP
jgi:signal peptidase